MLVGPPPGRSHLVGWFEPGLQAPMAKAFLSTFQACTLPSYVTAATKNRAFVEEYVSFQEGGSMKQACSGGATGRDLSRSHLLHQSIHFFSTEYVLFQRTCTTRWSVDTSVSRIRAWKEFKFLQKCYEIPGRLTPVLTEIWQVQNEN